MTAVSDAIDSVKRWFYEELHDQEGYEALRTPSDEEAHFILRYEGTDIGELWLSDGVWHFEYTEEFKEESEVRLLVGFPDPDKHYVSEQLWPFFALRIPSPKQPSIRRIVEEEGLDKCDEAQLLERFGRKTIDNPFLLDPAV